MHTYLIKGGMEDVLTFRFILDLISTLCAPNMHAQPMIMHMLHEQLAHARPIYGSRAWLTSFI